MKLKVLFALLFCALSAHAIPTQMNYQGYLADTAGEPRDTTVAMTFTLYDAAVAGAPLWTETHPVVNVQGGLFNVRLGSVTPLGDLFAADRWLGVSIGADTEMSPRQRIISVAHAYRVGTVDGASGGIITGDVRGTAKGTFGSGSIASGPGATVSGGNDNQATGDWSVIGGGDANQAAGQWSTLGGGLENNASGYAATVAGGSANAASGANSTVGGGTVNSANAYRSTIAGGFNNTTSDTGAFVGGGQQNHAQSSFSTIAGGRQNATASSYSTVGGGWNNAASDDYAFVGGGQRNTAEATGATIAGGDSNQVWSSFAFIGGGQKNYANAEGAVIAGGLLNTATDVRSTVGGGAWNTSSGLNATIGGGANNTASGSSATIGGGAANTGSGQSATIGGGLLNTSSGAFYSTVGGGHNNVSSGNSATIGGGAFNTSSGSNATIGGGSYNRARGEHAVVCGGGSLFVADSNSARGTASMIPGGRRNETTGIYSLAAGFRAKANHSGAFVWADNNAADFASSANNQFNIRASGGTRIYSNSGLTAGVTLAANGNAWVGVSDSTKKRDIHLTDTKRVLEKIAALPVKDWEYKSEADGIEHIGPMAQDFWNAFHLGSDSLGIATNDADGVLFAAVQELAKQNEKLEMRNMKLEATVAQLVGQVQTLLAANQKTLKEEK